MKKLKKINRWISALLLCAMLVAALAGCGNSAAESVDNTNNTNTSSAVQSTQSGTENNINGQGGANESEPVAMGRYVENVTDLSDRVSGYCSSLFRLADGTLIITDHTMPFLVSKDNGETWEAEKSDWWSRLNAEGHFIMGSAIGADNTIVVIYSDKDEDGGHTQSCLLIKPDGTEIPVERSSGTEQLYLIAAAVAENGRAFISVLGNDNIYEIKEDGSCELFLTIQNGAPQLMQFQGNLLVMDGSTYNAPLLYDIEKKEYVEDEALESFVKGDYKGGNGFDTDNGYEMFFFPGEEDILYIAGGKGLHRHVIGGSAMEQVIDGNLSTFGNPAHRILSVVLLENNEFLALFDDSRLVRFTYDPDTPTVPNERLKVYSLKENSTIQQAISLYQIANPEVIVQYEVGMSQDSAVTREDALKSLNTEIMAGEGPDVLILDGMPIASYIEKGLLADMTSMLTGLNGEEELFGNIVNAMKMDNGIYAMPCEIEIPVISAKEKYLSGMKDLEGIADTIETLRKENPEKNLISICSEKGVLRFFGMVCVPAWTDADGSLNKEAVTEFLTQSKRIYDAQMDGLPDKITDSYRQGNEGWLKNFGETREDSIYFRSGVISMDYVGRYEHVIKGTVSGLWSYCDLISANRVAGFEDCEWSVMNGQSSNVFCAETLLGINAASPYTAQAEDFIKLCLSRENQINLLSGLPVNKAALADICMTKPANIGENGEYGSYGSSSEDGTSVSYVTYWPDESQAERLRKCVESANTAYIEDAVIESVVYEEGVIYLQGSESLEEAVNNIYKKVAIYMAE